MLNLEFLCATGNCLACQAWHACRRLPTSGVDRVGFSRRKLQVGYQAMIGRQFCTPFDTNVQHWLEHVSWNYAEIDEWPLNQGISAPAAPAQNPLLERSVHYAQCIDTAQLQQQTSVLICQSHLSIPRIVPNVCSEIFQKDRGFICFNPLQGITNFFHEFRLQYTYVWGAYLHQTLGAV